MKKLTVKPGLYQHYKGNHYTVLGVATHSEDETDFVVYRPNYGEQGLWIRPLSMFCENVEVDGKSVPRFHYMGEAEQDKS